MTPAPRAVVVLAVIALAALVIPLGLAALAALALLVAVLVDARAARAQPQVERQAPEVLSRGIPVKVIIRAHPPTGGTVRVRQATPPGLTVAPQEGESGLEATIVAHQRGRHTLPAVATRSTGPLKLARWDHRPGGDSELRVFPDLKTARTLALAVARGRFRDQGHTARGPLGLGTEFELIRDYQPDDDIRQVNWRATARLGRPMSNQYRLEQDRDLLLLLDAGRLSAAPLGPTGMNVLDACLDAAVALGFVADELGDRTGAIAFDQEIRTALSPRRKGGQVVARTFFDLQPRPLDSDYELAFRRAEGSKRALVVVFTDLLEETAARPLVEAVPVLSRRHVVVVASPSDPALAALAQAHGDPLSDARAMIATDVLQARAKAAAQVRAAGARVLEAPPDRLPALVVAAYLRAKARAVL
ncbi:DUF58 domain-containing protein [Solirubrobacter ginsenosidimutans]|uniref:DUF58 domain-containing protein n=1 Tax=Solirubrobacter ginsenosidimutans TaxID=490573 RepID=A0A9X3N1T1_9ACTN|nr:DUF58 domain-containing protein [Solirubrobacter ginsenosidimutans]MDA0165498.1 DUF58 domain-containing protein [Solirubrobacter ginsenosidimutans]